MLLEFIASHFGIAAISAFFLLCSVVASVIAFRAAASSARSSQAARELAEEMRRLTAQVEAHARAPMRADAAADLRERDVDVPRDRYGARARQEAEAIAGARDLGSGVALSDHHLEAAKKAAIEPSALLRNRVRRR